MKTKPRIVLNAPVVIGFAALMFLATFLGILTGGRSTNLFFQTYRSSLASPLTYVRLFTHVLGHSGWSHFMGNAAYILLLGPMLEEKYGSSALVKVILITALVTGLVNNIFFSSVGLCGASGVVFAFIILTSFTGFKTGEIPLTFILVAETTLSLSGDLLYGIALYDGDEAVSKREERTMIDWNRDGKIDGWDHGFTAFLIDEANGKTASGCCGITVAMFLIGIILPVVLAVVFMAHA